jgi:hypothetical protein
LKPAFLTPLFRRRQKRNSNGHDLGQKKRMSS